MLKLFVLGMAIFGLALAPAAFAEGQWCKGATHVHNLWSDGTGFPETIADWYKSHGFDFVAFSEHNVLMEEESSSG